MANKKSAEKRNRQNIKARERNRQARGTIRTTIRAALKLASEGKAPEAKAKVLVATRMLDKAASKGLLHKKTASRTVSRLQKRVSEVKAA